MNRYLPHTIAVFLIATAGSTSVAQATSGAMTLSTSTTLSEDHQGTIVIAGDNVELDCNHHRITAEVRHSGSGVKISFQNQPTIRNCHITGFQLGVDAIRTTNLRVVDNEFFDNSSAGISVYYDPALEATGNYATESTNGIRYRTSISETTHSASWPVLSNNILVGNSSEGMDVDYIADSGLGPFEITIDGNTLTDNGSSGMDVYLSNTRAVIRGNTVHRNRHQGLYLAMRRGSSAPSSNFEVVSNNADSNGINGIFLTSVISGYVAGNSSTRNARNGLELSFSESVEAVGNQLSNNFAHGIRLHSGGHHFVHGNLACFNSDVDASIEDTEDYELLGNLFCTSSEH